jgi:cell filamentation protein
MSDRIYCYPESNVLINKLNIHSFHKLQEAERKITQLRLNDLIASPVAGNFDLSHLQNIHKIIFQD